MYSSEAISRNNMIINNSCNMNNANNMLFSNTNNNYKHGFDEDFLKNKATNMNMDMMTSSGSFHQEEQSNVNNGGLTRYRSAPSTFFSSFLDTFNGDNNNNNNNGGGGSSDSSSHGEDEAAESMLSAFINGGNNEGGRHRLRQQQMEILADLKQEMMEYGEENNGFYEASSSTGNGSNLLRQSSSPAGFFDGFDITREVGSFGACSNGESSSNSLNSHLNFAYRASPTSRFMPSIAENGSESTANGKCYVSGSMNASWDASASNNSLKRNRHGDIKMYSSPSGLENQKNECRNFASGLTHHLSLPKTSTEIAAVEKYLHFQQDVVPCKIRARRGCATHPRSIAERMRRTRISERMKKLQELFPNMDKQTNTADMLDLAVEYIKDLQNQVLTLTDVKAKCKCSSK